MAKNRKVQSAVVRFGPMIKALVICFLIGSAGVGYVGQKQEITRLGKEVAERERRLARLRDQGETLRKQLQFMQSHAELEAQIRRFNLGLAAPSPNQIIRLVENPASAEAEWPRPERLYADGRSSHPR